MDVMPILIVERNFVRSSSRAEVADESYVYAVVSWLIASPRGGYYNPTTDTERNNPNDPAPLIRLAP